MINYVTLMSPRPTKMVSGQGINEVKNRTLQTAKGSSMPRNLRAYFHALFETRHWKALINIILRCRCPVDFISRYLFGTGDYPHKLSIKNKKNDINIEVYTWHDILTVNEIFFREDYYIPHNSSVVVDFGSNIGVSALYFLTHSNCKVYMYEPVPSNLEKLYKNIEPYKNRCEIHPVAINIFDGICSFGIEKTGRHGGIGLNKEETIDVNSINIVNELSRILEIHTFIDVLKIDVESMELKLLNALSDTIINKIHYIHLEFIKELELSNNFYDLFSISKRGTVYSFKNRYYNQR